MKNILVISQNFCKGGVETQIYTQYCEMKKEYNFIFAFSNYTSELKFDNCKVYDDFHFSENSLISEFCEDVDRLIEIIKNNKIDIVHIHPFYSAFPAVFAAKICNIPVVYTIHGYSSYNFPSRINDVVLFQCMLESEIDKIFSTTQIISDKINNICNYKKSVWIPNAIDIQKYKKHRIVNNKKWALVSRLEDLDRKGLKKFISIVEKLDIDKVCIYGDGFEQEDIQNLIESNGLNNKVVLMGYCDKLYKELDNKYNGVIGIGRVAMESISMGYPTMLLGYNKIAGIVDWKMYNKIKKCNFVNKSYPDISIDDLNKQLSQLYKLKHYNGILGKFLKMNYSSQVVYKRYKNELNKVQMSSFYDLEKIYDEIKQLMEFKNEKIYYSRYVFNILKKYLEQNCITLSIKNYFVSFNNYFSLNDFSYEVNQEIKKEINNLKNDF